MAGFTDPAGFLLLLLAPIVILPYLLKFKRKVFRIPSALMLNSVLDDRQVNTFLRRRFRDISLLLVLLMLVLATLLSAGFHVDRTIPRPVDTLILLDRSASMAAVEPSGSTRFELAVDEVDDTLRQVISGGRVAILVFDHEVVSLLTFDEGHGEVVSTLREMSPRATRSDLNTALSAIYSVPRNDDHDLRTVVISDMSSDIGPALNRTLADVQNSGHHLEFLRIGSPLENLAITAMDVERKRNDPYTVEVFFNIHSTFQSNQPVTVVVHMDGSIVDALNLRIPASGDLGTVVTFTTGDTDSHSFRVEMVVDDPLLLDDVAFAMLPAVRDMVVLHVAPEGVGTFIDASLVSDGSIQAFKILPYQMSSFNFSAVDVVILDGIPPLEPSGQPPGLTQFLEEGGGLLIIGPAVSSQQTISSPLDLTLSGTGPPGTITHDDRDSTLLRYVDLMGSYVTHYPLVTHHSYPLVLASMNNTPVILADDSLGSRSMMITFPLEGASTDLVLRPAFPIFMSGVIRWLGEDHVALRDGVLVSGRTMSTGDALHIVGRDLETVTVVTPGMGPTTYEVEDDEFVLTETGRIGVYRVEHRGAVIPVAFSLTDGMESDLTPGPDLKATSSIEGGQVMVQDGLVIPILLMILLLFMVEWCIYHRGWS